MSDVQEAVRAVVAAAAVQAAADRVAAEINRKAAVQANLVAIVGGQSPALSVQTVLGIDQDGANARNDAYIAAVRAADQQKADDILAAEQRRQGAVAAAKDLLRSAGEIAF